MYGCETWIFTGRTWYKKLTHWKRPWCWERLRERGEGRDREWDTWMASLTQWTWVWVNSGREWRTGKPSMLQSMGLQRVRHDWAAEQQQICASFQEALSKGDDYSQIGWAGSRGGRFLVTESIQRRSWVSQNNFLQSTESNSEDVGGRNTSYICILSIVPHTVSLLVLYSWEERLCHIYLHILPTPESLGYYFKTRWVWPIHVLSTWLFK